MSKFKLFLPIAALLVLAGGIYAPVAAASHTQEAIFQDDAQMKANPAGTLATLRSLGVTRVRVFVEWSSIAPDPTSRTRPKGFNATNPAAYPAANWAVYDRIVQDAAAAGIGLDFTLTSPVPAWAEGPGEPRGGPFGVWKPSASDFRSFVQAVGTRYSGSYRPRGASRALPRVNFWAIWNEPNYGIDLAPQATDNDTIEVGAVAYRGLVNAAWSGLSASGHRHDTILIGETAPRGVNHPIGNFNGVKPLRWLRALYCVNSSYRELRGLAARERGCPTTAAGSRRFRAENPALFEASGFADHPYTRQGDEVAPNVPTNLTGGRKSDPDFADLPQVPKLESELDRLNRIYGSRTRFKIWNTEYGYRAKPPDAHANISAATAAYWMNWAEYLSWRNPRLVSYSQYLLVDSPTGFFASGLELANGTHTAMYDAYRMPLYLPVTSTRRGRKLEVWGCVRPAHLARGTQRVAIQFQAGSKGAFKTVSTVAIKNMRGYFDVRVAFRSSGAVRLAWTYPGGPTVFSRTVKIAIH